jgi:outer membrane protein TolC
LFLGLSFTLQAQEAALTLDSCQARARRLYPVTRQYAVNAALQDNALKRSGTARLPQVTVGGQATYQSDVTQIPQPNGESFKILSEDQYNLFGEVAQPITDLFLVDDQQAVIRAGHEVQQRQVDVELHHLREQVNQLFFSILHIDRQLTLNQLLRDELQAGRKKIAAAVENGIAIRSQVAEIDAELLRTDQRDTELLATRKGFTGMLAELTGQVVPDNQRLETPAMPVIPDTLRRPELALYDAQRTALDARLKVVGDVAIPKVSLFVRGGYGRPALDFFKNEFDFYYIGGIRLAWPVSALYTTDEDKQEIRLNQATTGIRKEQFLLQTQMNLVREQNEVDRYAALLSSDEELIRLRAEITGAARDQLNNGVMTATDYITYVSAEYRARQQYAIHEIQHLWAMYNLLTETGNE